MAELKERDVLINRTQMLRIAGRYNFFYHRERFIAGLMNQIFRLWLEKRESTYYISKENLPNFLKTG